MLLGLSHEGAYTNRCQMPKFEQFEVGFIKRVMVHILVTIQSCLDQWNKIGMWMFVMEGMLEWE